MAKSDAGNQKILSSKQVKVINALADGMNKSNAALAAGVHLRSVTRWLNDPEFAHVQDELRRRQAQATNYAATRLTGALDTSIDYLLEIIEDKEAPPSVRVRAALGIIDRQIQMMELSQVLERLEALENVIDA